ncbi:MAG: VOC family protein [Candidatus Sulfotelmatobacter sp.]
MPKRSLQSGNKDKKKIEQLHKAVEAMLARKGGRAPRVEAEIEPLVRIAAELRNLPSASFKARLKSKLEGKKTMATVAEPVAAVRTTASARIAFRDPAKAIEFYKQALGAKEIFRFEVGERDLHAEIMIGDSSLHISGEWPEGGRFSAETLGDSPISMSVHVPDVDAFAERATAAGMKVIRPLKDQFYGRRDVTLADPFGYLWVGVQVKEEMSVEEMHRRMERLTTGPEGGQISAKDELEKAVNPIPRGFHRVTPYIVTADGDAMLNFAKNAFGAEIMLRAEGGGAGGIHGVVRIGDTMLMMGGGIPGKPFKAEAKLTALHVYVEDTDAAYRKALDAGATSVGAPQDHEYGERGASVKDPFGNFWYIATHKGESYVPKGLHNVNVYLHPLRAEPVIGFLKRAFEAEEISKYASPDGVVHHAEIRVGDSVVEMGEAHGPYQPMPSMFYMYVPDCDAVYRRALAAGGKSLHELADQPYGDRNGAVTDPFGNIWYLATHVKDVGV